MTVEAPDAEGSTRPGLPFAVFAVLLVVVVGILAILDRAGTPAGLPASFLAVLALLLPVAAGLLSRTLRLSDFLLAGRTLAPRWNGLALAAGAFTGVYFLGLAGPGLALGKDAIVFLAGPAAGLLLMALFLAPAFRRSGAVTIPDFLALRYGGTAPRLLGALVLILALTALAAAELAAIGGMAGRFLGFSPTLAIWLGALAALAAALFGGMRGVAAAQMALFVLVAGAVVLPAALVLAPASGLGIPLPRSFGAALAAIEARGPAAAGFLAAFSHPGFDRLNTLALFACLAAGTAAMPHLLVRTGAAAHPRGARRTAFAGLVFLCLLYAALPVHAVFAEWIAEAAPPRQSAPLAMLAKLPAVAIAVFVAGALAAALASVAGLLHGLAASIGHDLHFSILDRNAQPGRRLIFTRAALIAMALVTAAAATRIADPLRFAAEALSLSAAALFPVLLLSSWRSTDRLAATAGMAAGLLVTLAALASGSGPGWLGIGTPAAGVFGLVAALVVMAGAMVFRRLSGSPATPHPSAPSAGREGAPGEG